MMIYKNYFPRDLLAELEQAQRELDHSFRRSPSIRGALGGYPATNVGSTPQTLEVHVFAPGMDPADLDVQIEKGILTISGERKTEAIPEKATVHIDERFTGRFRRAVSLPDDIDPQAVTAHYRDGVLHVSIGRKQAAQPRRVAIQ